MKIAKYTPEQKKEYYGKIKQEWREAKQIAEKDKGRLEKAVALMKIEGISLTGFALIERQMQEQGLEGLPVLDAKTYAKWKEAGYAVKKGEHSTLHGVTFIQPKNKDEKETKSSRIDTPIYMLPKVYKLFHRSQVEPLTK